MCAPLAIGIATAVIGGIGTIASYQQQQAQTTAANNAAWQQTVYQNEQIANQAQQNLRTNIFQLQQNNRAVEFQNQNILQQSQIQMDQVTRSNMRAHQEWLYAVSQNNYQNLNQQLSYTQELNRSRLSRQVAEIQQVMNQQGLNAEIMEAQRRLRDAQAVAAFEGERLMVSNLEASGSLLSTGRSGGSIGLAQQSIDAAYGRDVRMTADNQDRAKEGFYNEITNAYTKKVQADWEANASIIPEPAQPIGIPAPEAPIYAALPEMPIFAPMQTRLAPMERPAFAPAPVRAPGPSGIGLVAGIGGAILGGVQAGMQAEAMRPRPGQQPPR